MKNKEKIPQILLRGAHLIETSFKSLRKMWIEREKVLTKKIEQVLSEKRDIWIQQARGISLGIWEGKRLQGEQYSVAVALLISKLEPQLMSKSVFYSARSHFF